MSIENIAISYGDKVALPTGEDKEPCVDLFQNLTGIEVPRPKDRELSIVSQGVTFIWLKGADIPNAVTTALIDEDNQFWGVTGGDSLIESGVPRDRYRVKGSGQAMCTFALECLEDQEAEVRSRLYSGRTYKQPLNATTSFPVLLRSFVGSSDLNIGSIREMRGSVEISPKLYGDEVAADIVQKGKTARQNGLVIVESLMDVKPLLISGVRV